MLSLPNSIQIPLDFFDSFLSKIHTESELKVVLLAFRYYPQDVTFELLAEHPCGIKSDSIKKGLTYAVKDKLLIKTKDFYTLNFNAVAEEIKEPIKKERAKSDTFHARIIDAIYQITNKTCNVKAESKWAKLLADRIKEEKYTEDDVFECLNWAARKEFNFYAPSLLSVGKLMPKYLMLKQQGTLETYKETKQEAQGRKLEEIEKNKGDFAERVLNSSY